MYTCVYLPNQLLHPFHRIQNMVSQHLSFIHFLKYGYYTYFELFNCCFSRFINMWSPIIIIIVQLICTFTILIRLQSLPWIHEARKRRMLCAPPLLFSSQCPHISEVVVLLEVVVWHCHHGRIQEFSLFNA